MKTMTCKQLGGACDVVIRAETFLEMGKMSREHVMQQLQNGDVAHKEAVATMMSATPEQQHAWMNDWELAFNNAAEE